MIIVFENKAYNSTQRLIERKYTNTNVMVH